MDDDNKIQYAILANPGHNRVYFDNSLKLSLAEINLAKNKLEAKISNIKLEKIAKIQYIIIDCDSFLENEDLKIISSLSFFYALFYSKNNFKTMFPVEKSEYEQLNPSISSILKYQGKTNEIFTRMMINCAVFSLSDFNKEKSLNLFDPVCGKGTTLFEAAVLGYNVTGCDVSQKSIQETKIFFKKFLENDKIKHTQNREGYNIKDGKAAIKGDVFKFTYSSDKEKFKNNDSLNSLTLCCVNSLYCDKIFRKNSFDIIVGDLPYGIVHSNVSKDNKTDNKSPKKSFAQNSSSPTRNPSELIENCISHWQCVLKKDGVMALSWNTFVLAKKDLVKLIEKAGFEVLTSDEYCHFEHRVDQAILRDIIFARKV